MPADAVRLHGFRELSRAFAVADAVLKADLRDGLKEAAEPVRRDAESNALFNISNIGPEWSEMRVGVTQHTVYVAPKKRGVKSRADQRKRRPNLAPLLAEEMETALDENRTEVVGAVEDVLDHVGRAWERA